MEMINGDMDQELLDDLRLELNRLRVKAGMLGEDHEDRIKEIEAYLLDNGINID